MSRSLVTTIFAALLPLSVACGDDTETLDHDAATHEGGDGDGDGDRDAGDAGDDAGAPLDFAEVDEAIEQFLEDNELAGASAVIVHEDRGVVHTAGYGEYDPDRTYLVMSSSKIVSVGVLMSLQEEGVLDVDAPIGDYVGEWGDGGGKEAITLAQLVSGSSGMIGVVDDLFYEPYTCMSLTSGTLEECATAIYTADDAADRVEPDSEFHYGGAAWQLAGGIAEAASSKSWAELLEEKFLQPCGLSHSGFTNAASLATLMPNDDGTISFSGVGYPASFEGDPANAPETDNPSIEGGMYTTVGDYGQILLMHLRGGTCGDTRVLSEESVEHMREDRIASYDGSGEAQLDIILMGADQATIDFVQDFSGYGLGWWIDREHEGVVSDPGAFGSQAWLDLPRGYGVFIAIESNVVVGSELSRLVKPVIDDVFDRASE